MKLLLAQSEGLHLSMKMLLTQTESFHLLQKPLLTQSEALHLFLKPFLTKCEGLHLSIEVIHNSGFSHTHGVLSRFTARVTCSRLRAQAKGCDAGRSPPGKRRRARPSMRTLERLATT